VINKVTILRNKVATVKKDNFDFLSKNSFLRIVRYKLAITSYRANYKGKKV